MFNIGCLVKIEDIGQLAVCQRVARGKILLALDGQEFWISKRLCKVAA